MVEKVAVVGLGHVGLPLSLRIVESGFRCVGIDIDSTRVAALTEGKSPTRDVQELTLLSALQSGLSLTDSFEEITGADVIIICVPTPLDPGGEIPDLTPVLAACREIASRLSRGAVVVLESTVAPGTTEREVAHQFTLQGLSLDDDFFLGFSPERINPGTTGPNLQTVPKIVSGCSHESLQRVHDFYSRVFDTVITVSGTREAEFAKLLENTYRLVNISLVNELALAAAKMGIDFSEVVRAASTKPYGFEPFFPSAGAGGHCIPVDPVYLASEIRESTGDALPVVSAAIEVNKSIAARFLTEIIPDQARLNGARVLVVGISYKNGVSDTRNSAALAVINQLTALGSSVDIYDELVSEITVGNRQIASIDLAKSDESYDFAIVLLPQSDSTLTRIRRLAPALFTTSGFFGELR